MLKRNKVYQGDCLEKMKRIDDEAIDMILCDLPYGVTDCAWDTAIPFDLLWEQYNRIIKKNGAIVLTASQPFTSALIMSNPKMFRYCWVWEKNKPTGFLTARLRPLNNYEDVIVFSKGRSKYNPQGLNTKKIEKRKRTCKCTEIYKPYGSDYTSTGVNFPKRIIRIRRAEKNTHPTQKPVALFEYFIKTYTDVGDLVLDNCAGSGTAGVACQNTGRDFILMEMDEKYVDEIKQRLTKNNKVLNRQLLKLY